LILLSDFLLQHRVLVRHLHTLVPLLFRARRSCEYGGAMPKGASRGGCRETDQRRLDIRGGRCGGGAERSCGRIG
jgi:hypothetical protein